ncbi:choline kinase [Cladophialophora psammophila CBS 110553]|uniref:Choline kinase n=1 Tax=Cladophialophora psammophila CBS 110553 TaxID=1182543 RepID=W9WTM5_9EURO|nr:choline kinase [Cladophialophora psammophila CBS 110553]EXJ68350.1 choline kinase [Cladophialophora psammophila CBS 110553]
MRPSQASNASLGVTIFDEPEHIPEPNIKVFADGQDDGVGSSPTLVASHSPKLHRASISGKKMTGRPALHHSNSNSNSSHISSAGAPLNKPMSYLSLDDNNPPDSSWSGGPGTTTPGTTAESKTPDLRNILAQVADWLQDEKAKRQKQRHHRHHPHRSKQPRTPDDQTDDPKPNDALLDNEQDMSLERLENILQNFSFNNNSKLLHKSSSSLLRRGSLGKRYKQPRSMPASSDTEFFGDDILVPNVEAKLDNSKTMAFAGGSADVDTSDSARRQDYDHWVTFKKDIVRLTHTLKLKGWRRIPIDRAADIDVARLSGALTNAVYVVHPPKNMSEYDAHNPSDPSAPPVPISRRRPTSLLLRIYGPQVEHLIDREAELGILRRLARKSIGPRLLGSFENGRFEEFLHAKTLTAEDLRIPETSKQIAKRMRELHEGIELLESELDAGPAVFVNWDKWVDRCEKVITWLDNQVHQAERELTDGTTRRKSTVNARYVRRGLICGVEWPVFRRAYDAYRKRLIADSGGREGIRKLLVFAHNDTQYGNLMRLQPSGTSPLLQPSNQHKQLVVIDFEYAAQNTVGLEFANHFTEWCYNYHNPPDKNFQCDTRRYPDEREQYRFVRSYVMHRPQFNPAASATPKMEGREKTNISDFMLDARTPGGGTPNPWGGSGGLDGGVEANYDREESEREKAQEEEIQRLLQQTRVWRMANSAQWVAWGIVQAKVPELDALEEKAKEDKMAEKTKSKRRKSVTEMVSAGEKKIVDKVKSLVGKDGVGKYHQDDHSNPMSDPLTGEEKRMQVESHWDRPEGRAQEEAHHEGNGDIAVSHRPDASNNNFSPCDTIHEHAETHSNLEPAITTNGDRERSRSQLPARPQIDSDHNADTEMTQVEGQPRPDSRPSSPSDHGDEPEDEFDYLAYAQERAMFFWGDCLQMGLVEEDELPVDLKRRVKLVSY